MEFGEVGHGRKVAWCGCKGREVRLGERAANLLPESSLEMEHVLTQARISYEGSWRQ
jgi:hypothetical protein